ncbi:MAG TPA: NUDIX domain-containing protein [Acidimicrobiia bacterium]
MTSVDPAATVILLRPSPGGFEVLMVVRNARGYFGSYVVFPGGRVDEIDRRGADEEADARRAAIRELAEEAGIVLTIGGTLLGPSLKGSGFYAWLETESVETGVDELTLVSRWVTPEPAPRRFDTRFYIASCDDAPEVRLDHDELIDHSWVTPTEALDRNESGEWPMILPTLAHLRWLRRRVSIEDALSSARGADGRSLIQPRLMEDGSILPVHLPAEVS